MKGEKNSEGVKVRNKKGPFFNFEPEIEGKNAFFAKFVLDSSIPTDLEDLLKISKIVKF